MEYLDRIMKNKSLYLVSSILAFSIVICFVDGVIKPNYFTKIPIKIIFFLVLPLLFFVKNKEDLKEF